MEPTRIETPLYLVNADENQAVEIWRVVEESVAALPDREQEIRFMARCLTRHVGEGLPETILETVLSAMREGIPGMTYSEDMEPPE